MFPDDGPGWTKEQFTDLRRLIEDRCRGEDAECRNWVGYGHRDKTPRSDCRFQAGGEWLYDFTWIQYSRKGEMLAMPLAIESEYHRDQREVVYELEKLMASRALVRAVVFQTPETATREMLEHHIRTSPIAADSDVYLFAFWDNAQKQYRTWRFEAWMDEAKLLSD